MSKSHLTREQQEAIAFQKRTTTYYQPATGPTITAPVAVKRRRFSWKRFGLMLSLIVLVPMIIIGGWDLYNFSIASQKLFGSNNALALLRPTRLDSHQGRVNVLLIGYSADDPDHGGANLTDSILILSLHQKNQTGYMLSIPRDLYVDIPGNGPAKINEAYQDGEADDFNQAGYSQGGIGLLEKTIDDNFGLKLHYYALVNYAAVRQTVDALGGVTVAINSPDSRGLYDPNFQRHEGGPLKLANGRQAIDGQTALRLTRARGATFGSYGFPQSDFNRTQNQQLVLAAIKDRLSWRLVLDPRLNGQIFAAAADNVQTNVAIDELLPLYRLFKKVPETDLQPVSLRELSGRNLLSSYRTPSGQSALIPAAGYGNFAEIKAAIADLNQAQ